MSRERKLKELLNGGTAAVVFNDLLGPITVTTCGDMAVEIVFYDQGRGELTGLYVNTADLLQQSSAQFVRNCTSGALQHLIQYGAERGRRP